MSILSVENLSICIGEDARIQKGFFDINKGDVVLLTGPNGSGKSTIIKIIMGDVFDYKRLSYDGTKIIYTSAEESYNLLNSETSMEMFRQRVCYISQEDEFESPVMLDCFLMSIDRYAIDDKPQYVFDFVVENIIADSFYLTPDISALDRQSSRIIKRLGLNRSSMTDDEVKAVKFLSLRTNSLSGGQKKLANIFANLIRYEFCDLLLLDEPLNNLDYGNVRAFSNALTHIYKRKPELGILIVTHCRSIPIINKVIEIDPFAKQLRQVTEYTCNSCFGRTNDQGMYV